MKKFYSLLIVTFALNLNSCNREKTLNGESMEAFSSSLAAMKASLPIEKREEFEKAMLVFMMEEGKTVETATDAEGVKQNMFAHFDGMTASEIFARVEEIQSNRSKEQK